jgi:hypothetical protein
LSRHGDEDPRAIPLEHFGVCPLAFLALEEHVHLDVPEFFPGTVVVDVSATVEVGDHDDTLFIVIIVE